jgi:transcriptional regulator with XRE-family HTH domain
MKTAREHLAGELRRLRELSGRSLKDLEADTHASDSSLSRYLSGKTVPPWSVVERLCRVAGCDTDELRPIWAAAQHDDGPGEPPATITQHNAATAAAVAAAAQGGVPAPVRNAGIQWRQAVVFLAVGALLGIAGMEVPKLSVASGDGSNEPSGTNGPHFSVTLRESARQGITAIWSFNARCGNADEYRLVYDLPIAVQRRASAYRLDHADCTIKLFDGIGGSGIGEPLTNDQKLHPVPPELARRGSSIAAYSCCNGTVLDHHP